MKINNKLLELKKTIEEIKKISEKAGKDNVFETNVDKLNNEIKRLKKGISESVEELEEFLKE